MLLGTVRVERNLFAWLSRKCLLMQTGHRDEGSVLIELVVGLSQRLRVEH